MKNNTSKKIDDFLDKHFEERTSDKKREENKSDQRGNKKEEIRRHGKRHGQKQGKRHGQKQGQGNRQGQGSAQRGAFSGGKVKIQHGEYTHTGEKKVKIIPLGGQEEVGRNMTIFEYGNDIVILDMGMQFPEEDMPGVDYIVPDISYLKGKEKNIRGVILSHGHLDHIGAAPILLRELGYPPVIGRDLTLALVKKKMEDFEKKSSELLKTIYVKSLDSKLRLGEFQVGFFDVEHSVMDAVGVTLNTPEGTIIHPGDWTLERDERGERILSYENLANLPRPTTLMLESLGALDYGVPTPEAEMYRNIKKLIDQAQGKVIIGTFSSQIRRIGQIIEYAFEVGKKVALDGYSMKMNIEIAKELGYIKAPKDTLIDVSKVNNYPDNKVIVICTGAQGEDNAALSRIVNNNHKFIRINRKDTVVFSSSVIPGNERTIQRLKDNLYRKSDNVYHTDIMDVHTSGHCNAEDIKEVIKQIKPDFYVPVYANHYFLKEAQKLAVETGFKKENSFILDNGSILEIKDKKAVISSKKVKTDYVFIDGLGIGDVGQVVLRDRQVLAEDGMFMITVIIESKTKKIVGNIQVISRGFIFVKENFDLVNATKLVVKKVIKEKTSPDASINWKYVKDNIREEVGKFLYQKTQRRPMILPEVIEV
ncbi:MAG: ribonuclease J [Candidatus Moranbacteria bacterium]|nr:ribonuclease J [Candidatus Moranbacteria bacterium]